MYRRRLGCNSRSPRSCSCSRSRCGMGKQGDAISDVAGCPIALCEDCSSKKSGSGEALILVWKRAKPPPALSSDWRDSTTERRRLKDRIMRCIADLDIYEYR
jgi:hypothetical protein